MVCEKERDLEISRKYAISVQHLCIMKYYYISHKFYSPSLKMDAAQTLLKTEF